MPQMNKGGKFVLRTALLFYRLKFTAMNLLYWRVLYETDCD